MKLIQNIFLLFSLIYINSLSIHRMEDNSDKYIRNLTEGEQQSNIYLILVNKQNKLPDDWTDKVDLVNARNSNGKEFQVEVVALQHFEALREKLFEQGIDIELDSTYRSVEKQKEVWDEFEKARGIEYCKQYVAVPGHSEHHTGLAIDVCLIKDGRIIDDNDQMIREVEIFSKVHEKLADYGFILRFLKGKESITGYSYEPWHFRYVGEEVAKYIYHNNLTLEEYLDQLKVKNSQ